MQHLLIPLTNVGLLGAFSTLGSPVLRFLTLFISWVNLSWPLPSSTMLTSFVFCDTFVELSLAAFCSLTLVLASFRRTLIRPWLSLAALHPASVLFGEWWMVKANGGLEVSAAVGARSLLEGLWCSTATDICCYLSMFLSNMCRCNFYQYLNWQSEWSGIANCFQWFRSSFPHNWWSDDPPTDKADGTNATKVKSWLTKDVHSINQINNYDCTKDSIYYRPTPHGQ